MPRRRKRRLNWTPVLWLLVLANIAAGLWLSPVTAVRKLRIEGARADDRPRLEGLAQALKALPIVTVSSREFESRVLGSEAVRSADFRRTPFGSASLVLIYRRPVAQIEGATNAYLCAEGAIFRSNLRYGKLPSVKLHVTALRPTLTAVGAAPFRAIAQIVELAQQKLSEKPFVVDVDSEGAVCLNISQAATVVLGSADRLDEKFRALEGLLAERPNMLQEVVELNLTEPSRPVVRGQEGPKQ